jgi:outer membrane murein-binding lipoprotein Lpp
VAEQPPLVTWDVDHAAGVMGGSDAGSTNDQRARAAFTRLQTLAQQQAAIAQERGATAQGVAAQAAKETAEYTRKNARYLLWSVIILAASSLGSFGLTAWNFWGHHSN